MWTQFWDMHSGGSQKEDWAQIFIEAPEEEAEIIFYNRFGHNPHRVTCTCCGSDYSISESEDLAQATAFHRNCKTIETKDPKGWKWVEEPDTRYDRKKKVIPVEEYIEEDGVLVIYAKDIKPVERRGSLPTQGYVWVD